MKKEGKRRETIVFLGQRDDAFDSGGALEDGDGFLGGGDDSEWFGSCGGGDRECEGFASELE